MRRIRPEAGVTLIELVVAMVVLAIVGSIVIYFIYPVRQRFCVSIPSMSVLWMAALR